MSRKTINVIVPHSLGAEEALKRLGQGDPDPRVKLKRLEAKFIVETPVGEVSGQLTIGSDVVRIDTNENPRLLQLVDSMVETKIKAAVVERLR